jgi:hypothetical protein
MKKHPKSLVYVFANGCSSERWLHMAAYEDCVKKPHQKLFLVMTGFGNLRKTIDQLIESDFFAIDGDFYQEEKRSKYTLYFENELSTKLLKSR